MFKSNFKTFESSRQRVSASCGLALTLKYLNLNMRISNSDFIRTAPCVNVQVLELQVQKRFYVSLWPAICVSLAYQTAIFALFPANCRSVYPVGVGLECVASNFVLNDVAWKIAFWNWPIFELVCPKNSYFVCRCSLSIVHLSESLPQREKSVDQLEVDLSVAQTRNRCSLK